MTAVIDAVYRGGVFRPATPPDLPDGTPVRLTVVPATPAPPPDPDSPGQRAYRALAAIAALHPGTGPVEHTSRDHDRILYDELQQ